MPHATTCSSSAAGPSGAAAAYWLATQRPSGPRRREEAVPAREDLRRRPHAAGGAPAPRHGARRPARRLPALRRPAVDRRTASRSSSPGPTHPDFPPYGYVVRRRELDEMVAERAVKAGRHPVAGDRGDRRRSSRTALVTGAIVHRQGHRRDRDGPGALRDRRRRRQLPVRPGARHRPRPHRTRWAWRFAAISRARYHDDPWIESHLDIRDRDGQPFARVRVDLPGRRRHGERRRRPAVDVHGLEVRQHDAI